MSSNRKIQPVSFSLSDPFEQKLLDHAIKNGAFSKYVKRLIQRDMEKGAVRVIPGNIGVSGVGNTNQKPISMGGLTGIILEP